MTALQNLYRACDPAHIGVVGFAIFALLDWVAVARDSKPLEYIAKPATMAFLILYAAEFARQHNLSNNPRTFALDYLLLEPGLKAGPVTLRLGYERLEGDGAAAPAPARAAGSIE